MEPFISVRGPAAPLLRPDVDTDLIAPAHSGTGDLSRSAFAPLRYLPDGSDDPAFVLNRPEYAGAPILLAGANFGCGSSRETAVWSLAALGIRCVIAPSFGDIFAGNCVQNGLLPIVLDRDVIGELAAATAGGEPVEVDLQACRLRATGIAISFHVDASRRTQLLEGLDDLDLGLRRRDLVREFQAADRVRRPWVYGLGGGDRTTS